MTVAQMAKTAPRIRRLRFRHGRMRFDTPDSSAHTEIKGGVLTVVGGLLGQLRAYGD